MSPRAIVVIGVCAFAAVAALLWFSLFAPESHTYGRISISSPEVFTRERLVNDRYQQDAWLKTRLQQESDCSPNATATIANSRQGSIAVGTSGEVKPESVTPPAQSDASHSATAAPPRSLNWDCFEQSMDYREQIRSLLIENQLDDRHDLNGSSLFRLKFDIAVVPGQKTDALATIQVKIAPADPHAFAKAPIGQRPAPGNVPEPECQKRAEAIDLDDWQPIYDNWLENVEKRLNQTQKEQRQRFDNNVLSRSDYLELARYLKSKYAVKDIASLKLCDIALPGELEKVDALPLKLGNHIKWKQCLTAIHDAAPKLTSMASFKGSGDYHAEVTSSLAPFHLDVNAPELVGLGDPDALLDEYFAKKSLLLVLGSDDPIHDTKIGPSAGSSSVSRIFQLSFIRHGDDAAGSGSSPKMFKVLPRSYTTVAIDKNVLSEQAFDNIKSKYSAKKPWFRITEYAPTSTLKSTDDSLAGAADWIEWFPSLDGVAYSRFTPHCGSPTLDSKVPLATLEDDVLKVGMQADAARLKDYPFTRREVTPTSVRGIYLVKIKNGLYNFVIQLRTHTQPYTYAVSPQENGMLLHLQHKSDRQFVAMADSSALTAKDRVSAEDGVTTDEMRYIASVVGFGEAASDGTATFGWAINPQNMSPTKGKLVFNQSLKKYAVSALISVPSWWQSLSITTRTAWRDQSGGEHEVASGEVFRIEIPSDPEAFEQTVLGMQGPELDASALDPIRLKAGLVEQRILIPGRRLWRSTEVTIGDQHDDSIEVLPNMKGIIATFKQIYDSATPDEKAYMCINSTTPDTVAIRRTVRVWTSQGTVTLPQPAIIYVPWTCSRVSSSTKIH